MKKPTCKFCQKFFVKARIGQKCCSIECTLEYLKTIPKKEYFNAETEAKKENKAWKERKKELILKHETLSDCYTLLQKEINTIAREIDKGYSCISSGRFAVSYDGGHYYSVGAAGNLRFNLHNIYAQSVHDNRDKHGNLVKYRERLIAIFGITHFEYIESLHAIYPKLDLSKDEVKEKTKIARDIVKELKHRENSFTLKERIEKRHEYNQRIGIYL
jgi:hypothetical protein